MKQALQFIARALWRWDVVGIGSTLLYGFGVGAMYGDDYIIAAVLFFAGIAWLTAKVLAWEETKGHPQRRGISVLILVIGISAFGGSLLWIRHRHKDGSVSISFVQLYNIVPLRQRSTIGQGKLLSMNVIFVDKQLPSHDVRAYSGLGMFTPALAVQKFEDFKKEAQQEVQTTKPRDLGIEDQAWNTGTLGPLSEEEAKGLLDGSRRLYFWSWVTWKDPKNTTGTTEVCRWLQKPLTNQLEEATMVWHFCD